MPSMRIVREMTCGLGESVTPNTQFQQSWMLENNGDVAWPQGCYLKLLSEVNNEGKMFVPPIAPHETHIITITLVSPAEIGQFKSQFCLCTPGGAAFGSIIWSVVDVSISGTLALTQQLQQLHTSQPPKMHNQNPQQTGWEEDGYGMGGSTQQHLTSMALVPHCSNGLTSEPFPIANNQVSFSLFFIHLYFFTLYVSELDVFRDDESSVLYDTKAILKITSRTFCNLLLSAK